MAQHQHSNHNEKLATISNELRKTMLMAALNAGKGHVPPAFSCIDLMVFLYFSGFLNFSLENHKDPNRDRFFLSKGHACLALYSILSKKGFFTEEFFVKQFCKPGSILAGHPDLEIPGAEMLSGSLGHGLSVGCGLALARDCDPNLDFQVAVLLGDGECAEGSIWEAAAFAGHNRLKKLFVMVDNNKLGATDYQKNIISTNDFEARWKSFGFEVFSVDGHNFEDIESTFKKAKTASLQGPVAIIANTVKGKGVPFMENSPLWHHSLPKNEDIQRAFTALENYQG